MVSEKSKIRPSKDKQLNAELKQIERQDASERNAIEGKFGEGKRRYGLGLISTCLQLICCPIPDNYCVIIYISCWKKLKFNISNWDSTVTRNLFVFLNKTVLFSKIINQNLLFEVNE